MSRHVVAGILGLALAGCALDRSVASRSRSPLTSVALTPPLPTIHETINQENPLVDSDSIRAGHPTAATAARPRATRVAPVEGDPGTEVAPDSGTAPVAQEGPAPPAGEGRPAPFAKLRGRLRPRSEDVPPDATPSPHPVPEDGPAEAPDPQPQPAPSQAEATDGAGPGLSDPSSTDLPAAVESGPAGEALQAPPVSLPEPEESGDQNERSGETAAPAPEPAPEPGPITPSAADVAAPPAESSPTPSSPSRDPLLGSDPDIMPSFDDPHAPKRAQENEPAAENPADQPATAAPSPTQPDPAAGASGSSSPPVIRLSAPTEIDPAPPTPAAGAEAANDPLLGASPDIMPRFDLPPAREEKTAARSPSIPSNGGRPPSVSAIVGISREADAPVAATPEPASARPASLPTEAASPPGPVAAESSPSDPPAGESPAPPTVIEVKPERPEPAPGPDVIELQPQTSPQGPAPATAPGPVRDLLLGANPDIMPSVQTPAPPAKTPPAATAVTPETAPLLQPEPTPAPVPEPKPAPAPAPAPTPTPRPPAKSTPPPAPSVPPKPSESITDPVELPPLSNPEASTSPGVRGAGGFASVPVSAPREEGGEPSARKTADEPTAVRSRVTPRAVFTAGKPAAWVGDEVITLHELTVAFKQRRKGMPADQELTPEMRYYMARTVLNDMVDRALVIQEARRELKDVKRYQKFMEMADKVFFDDEVPPLLRQTASADVTELKKKLADRGESLDELREQFRLEFLSRGYMEQKLGPKMKVDLREMREYYLAHLKDFDLPAEITWREVLVEFDRFKSRAEARRKADALLTRLRHGEDFAAVARAESDGPNKSDGGLWKTSPGGYALPAVNAALGTLPVGQVSPVIEGPTSYHIVVVEGRREAGPATFAEVQDKVFREIRRQKVTRETTAYIEKLRNRTVIRTVFDPAVTRASAEVVIPPSQAPRP